MLGEILRFRSWRRGPAAPLLLVLLTAGLTGHFALTERAPAPRGSVQETALADPVASVVPQSAPAVTPPPAVTSAPAVTSRPAPVPAPRPAFFPAPVRSPSARPDGRSWIASSAPLGASPPVRVEVVAVGVTAPIGPLGLNQDGTLQVPSNFSRAGWYTGRPTPGETGPAIIVAHRSSRGPGAFWKRPDVEPGEEIVVTRADGRRTRFTVDRVEQHRKDAFPTEAVYGPTPEPALRLITCGGPFEPALGDHYRDNVIVFAHLTGWA